MKFKTILFEKRSGIAKVTLNRPEKRNALNMDMRGELIEVFGEINDNDSVKICVLTGAGGAFCSGGDITTMEGLTPVATRFRIKHGQKMIRGMVGCEKPIIGAINGVAAGAGVNIALACDILIASEEARFGLSFVKIGAIPDLGGFFFLPLRVGIARAKELMFTGNFVDAREAERIGLVNRVVPAKELDKEVNDLANQLSNGPSQAYAMIKAALNQWPVSLGTLFEMECTMQALAFDSDDFDEGRRAFLEKRKPSFRGK